MFSSYVMVLCAVLIMARMPFNTYKNNQTRMRSDTYYEHACASAQNTTNAPKISLVRRIFGCFLKPSQRPLHSTHSTHYNYHVSEDADVQKNQMHEYEEVLGDSGYDQPCPLHPPRLPERNSQPVYEDPQKIGKQSSWV